MAHNTKDVISVRGKWTFNEIYCYFRYSNGETINCDKEIITKDNCSLIDSLLYSNNIDVQTRNKSSAIMICSKY